VKSYDALVVGAGFAGSVTAERLASQLGKRVLVIDRRPHIGGNAYDERNEDGVLVHRYGPHIFHTNSDAIFGYLSTFTEWRPYEHRVLAHVRDQFVPIPINRTTVNRLFGLQLTDDAAVEAFYAARAEPRVPARTSEDVVVGSVGRELYELFFRGYTRKQWGLDPSELDASVTARVPTRVNADDRYFTDTYQAMPAHGYTAMFARMLDHPRIDVRTGVDFAELRGRIDPELTVFTGPIDEYFDYRHGRLPYRSLRFEFETIRRPLVQPVGTLNYPAEDVPYTRTSEFKHLTGQTGPVTTIVREFPSASGDPYYPIPRPENADLYRQYRALAEATPNVWFVGRLATYKYYNMDQVVGQALATFRKIADSPVAAAA
jgi:UDP-galactopyranose mutase